LLRCHECDTQNTTCSESVGDGWRLNVECCTCSSTICCWGAPPCSSRTRLNCSSLCSSIRTTTETIREGTSKHQTYSESLHFIGLAISACLFTWSPRPSCPADSCAAQTASAILRACLAMFCTSATSTATAFPSPCPPCHVLCTSHIPSFPSLPHPPLPPQIPVCFSDCVVPILNLIHASFSSCPFWLLTAFLI
jgi:hypothetical protein